MEEEIIYEKTEDGNLKTIYPEIPAYRPEMIQSPDVLDEQWLQSNESLKQAQDAFDLIDAQYKAAHAKGIVDTEEPVVDDVITLAE